MLAAKTAAAEKPPAENPANRRRHKRVRIEVPLEGQTDTRLWGGLALNVSQGGVLVQSPRNIPEGETLLVELTLEGGPRVVVQCEVRWRQMDDQGRQTHIGLMFKELPVAAERALQSWVNEHPDNVEQRF